MATGGSWWATGEGSPPTVPQGIVPSVPVQGGEPTVPLRSGPYLTRADGPSRSEPARYLRGDGGRGRRFRRARRRVRRTVSVLVSLGVLGGIAFVGVLLETPSVSNAPALARALDRAHHAVYPGPAVPRRFAAALISTEDHRFYSEPGFDPFAVARVVWGRITDHPDQGGATLYQQLAKMLYGHGRTGLVIEAEEATLGIKLNFAFPKAEILRMYADVVYFGHNYYGLQAASCGYFGVRPARLTWPQVAVLAGIVQAPSADDPLTHLAAARGREAHVLGRLVATGILTQAQAARAYRQPLHLVRAPHVGCAAS